MGPGKPKTNWKSLMVCNLKR